MSATELTTLQKNFSALQVLPVSASLSIRHGTKAGCQLGLGLGLLLKVCPSL